MRITLIITALLCICVLAQTQQPQQQPQPGAKAGQATQQTEEQIQAELNQTAASTINWETNTSAGAKVEVQLLKKDQVDGKPVVQYHIKVSGVPRNKLYNLMAWPVTLPTPMKMMEGLAIAADGTVGCPPDSNKSCAQRMKGAELKLTYSPGIGEIFRHALVSEDRQSRIFFTIVPAPMVENDKSCSVELVRLSPRFELALIRGKGFAPGELINFHTQSYQEAHDSQPKVDAHGEFWAVLTPFVKGRTMGMTEVMVKSKACAPVLSFEWGSQ